MSAIADFKKMEVGQTFGTGLPAPSEGPPRLIFAQKERDHAAMITFYGFVGFPPSVAEKSYINVINKLQLCSNEVAESSMLSAALKVVTLTNSSDIVISGDGT
ncbi:hypothetical protein TNCV_2304571 [Trichonephila clavipes]|nr:hypothetical protein TNCV_2304571 [Trichonephila clavipes]